LSRNDTAHRVIHATPIHEHNYTIIAIDCHNAVGLCILKFSSAIPRRLDLYPRNLPQCIAELIIMTFLKHIPINDIHITARAIVGLLRYSIAKRIFELTGDLNILRRI